MNSNIREDLTGLLAEHLNHDVKHLPNFETVTEYWQRVAVAAMDFIYGSEHGDVPQPELQEADPSERAEGIGGHGPGDCGRSDCHWCRDLDRVETGVSLLGIMYLQESQQHVFSCHGPLSPTEGSGPAPRPGYEPKVQ